MRLTAASPEHACVAGLTPSAPPLDVNAAQRQFWDQFAAHYEQQHEPNTTLVAQLLHEHLNLQQARDVLEVAAGAGAAALALARRLQPGARLVLTDLSMVMLRRLREKLQRELGDHGQNIEVANADAQYFPFPDGAFDRYLANLGLMLVADPEHALAEAARVLRPAGQIALSVWGRRANSPLRTLYFDALQALDMPLPPAPARTPFYLGGEGVLRGMLLQAGFASVVTWYHPMVVPVDQERIGDFAGELVDTEFSSRQLDPTLLPRLRWKVAELIAGKLAAGYPIVLEILMAVGRKAG